MLSRIAESLFWLGRYIERADDTARLLDVHLQQLIEDPWVDEETACNGVLAVMGIQPVEHASRQTLLDRLLFDAAWPGSITGAIVQARENARGAREIISAELWESLNVTFNSFAHASESRSTHEFLSWVRDRATLSAGHLDTTMPRDLVWNFVLLGRSLERADMTARIVASRTVWGASGPNWSTVLGTCGAHEAFLRAHRGREDDALAAQFLTGDRYFPRSVLFALKRAEGALARCEGNRADGDGATSDAARILGRARSHLEYLAPDDLVPDLAGEMTRIQLACSQAADAIRVRFFTGTPSEWVGERQ